MKNDKFYEDDADMTPNTPVVKDSDNRDKDDPNEILLGDEEFAEDETDDMEEEYDD
jgi:hypothetical protein